MTSTSRYHADTLLQGIVADTAQHANATPKKGSPPLMPISFFLSSDQQHHIEQQEHEQWQLEHAERRILRNPRDLISHAQRLRIYRHQHHRTGCFAALIDLSIVLGMQGQRLRRALLHQNKALLTTQQHDFLLTRIKTGLCADDPMPKVPASLLSKNISGTTAIVTSISNTPQNHPDRKKSLLKSARQYIQSGDDQTAQKFLEQALDNDPGDKAACDELLALYLRNQRHNDLIKTYTELSARKIALPELWDSALLCLGAKI